MGGPWGHFGAILELFVSFFDDILGLQFVVFLRVFEFSLASCCLASSSDCLAFLRDYLARSARMSSLVGRLPGIFPRLL